LITGGSI